MFKPKEKKEKTTITLRYKFKFIDLPKKVNRSLKKLNMKSFYALTETQEWLEKISTLISEPILVTIACHDDEAGVEYELDGVKIYADTKPNLLEIIEQQFLEAEEIQNSSHIVTTINRQYQDEVANGGYEFVEEMLPETYPVTDMSTNENEVTEGDDEEVDEVIVPEETEEEALPITLPSEDDEQLDFDEEEPETMIQGHVDPSEPYNTQHNEGVEYSANYSAVVQPIQQKHTVAFPEYENYHSLKDVQAIEETITRFQQRLQPDNLVKMLGLTTLADQSDNKLKEITYHFAMNSLNEQEFVLLNDHFIKEQERILKMNNGQLSKAYESAMLTNYEQEVLELKAEEIETLNSQAQEKVTAFETEQTALFLSKKGKLQVEHEAQIKALESKQHNEMALFEATENERLNNLSAQVKHNAEKEATEHIERLKKEEEYKLKSQAVRFLVDGKREMIDSTITELDEAINNVGDHTLDELEKLKERLAMKTPEWRNEIQEQQMMRLKEQAEAREQQKIDLEREKLESERINLDRLKSENENLVYELRESKLDKKGLQNENALLREKNEQVGVFSRFFK